MEKFFESIWYSRFSLFSFILLPFSILFYVLIKIRLYLYDYNFLHKYTSGKPSIIVGNITVGGSGKTPLVIWLAKYLSGMGLKVGVVSSGYKAMIKTPVLVNEKSNPNGALNNIAGIFNKEKNILGMMPHPERMIDKYLSGDDGSIFFQNLLSNLK